MGGGDALLESEGSGAKEGGGPGRRKSESAWNLERHTHALTRHAQGKEKIVQDCQPDNTRSQTSKR